MIWASTSPAYMSIMHLNEQVRDLQQENAALRSELARRTSSWP